MTLGRTECQWFAPHVLLLIQSNGQMHGCQDDAESEAGQEDDGGEDAHGVGPENAVGAVEQAGSTKGGQRHEWTSWLHFSAPLFDALSQRAIPPILPEGGHDQVVAEGHQRVHCRTLLVLLLSSFQILLEVTHIV